VFGGLIMDFGGVLTEPALAAALPVARARGLKIGLLSNADRLGAGDWAQVFDAVVLSGEEGFGKPDPRIYRIAAQRLGLPPESCVFVDDLAGNVRGAAAVGMVGVHHQDPDTTLAELAALFGFPLTTEA
jgi:putative hydrolase of the HAD superfamily